MVAEVGGSDHMEPCTRLWRALKVIAKIWPLFEVRWEAIGSFEAEMRLILKGISVPAVLRGDWRGTGTEGGRRAGELLQYPGESWLWL